MASYGQGPGGQPAMERPEGMTAKDERLVKMVAMYVARSVNSARFQREVQDRTQHNHHFLFMEHSHPWHRFYTFWVSIARSWNEEQRQQQRRRDMLEQQRRRDEERMGQLPPTAKRSRSPPRL